MNVKDYRKRYEAEISKAADDEKDYSVDETRDLLAKKAGSSEDRVAAIEGTVADANDLGVLVAQYLQSLGDGDETVEVRLAALDALKVADLLGPQFDAYRADYFEALRGVATDGSPTLRENALEVLAIQQDAYAQEALLSGLRDSKAALVSPAKAIQLLGYDDHGNAVQTVREYFNQADDTSKEEALRLLATDPGSEDFISGLLRDKSQQLSIRQLSAAALQNINSAEFEKVAREIVTDDEDLNEIRASCLSALTANAAEYSVAGDEGFAEQVSNLKKATRSTNLRSSINRFLKTR